MKRKLTFAEWIEIISLIGLVLSATSIQYIDGVRSGYINRLNQDIYAVLNYQGLISEQYGRSILAILKNNSEIYIDSLIKGDELATLANRVRDEKIIPKMTNPPLYLDDWVTFLYFIQFLAIGILIYLNFKKIDHDRKTE